MGGPPWLEPWAWRLALVLLAAGIMTLGLLSRRWKSSLTLALGIGLAFRVAVVALSYRHTPGDAAIVFRHSAELVRAGRNPVFAPEWRGRRSIRCRNNASGDGRAVGQL